MYSVSNKKYKNKGKILDKTELIDISGFMMSSKKKVFKINDTEVREIKVVNKKLANPLVSRKVNTKYKKLIVYLTDLLVDDDDTGDSFREALNQIEKFRLEIKNKYREFLKQKELEMMSKQLTALKKEANARLLEIQNSYEELMNENKRSK
jgi:hypoxanthine phosphoribosyltransferase